MASIVIDSTKCTVQPSEIVQRAGWCKICERELEPGQSQNFLRFGPDREDYWRAHEACVQDVLRHDALLKIEAQAAESTGTIEESDRPAPPAKYNVKHSDRVLWQTTNKAKAEGAQEMLDYLLGIGVLKVVIPA